MNAIALWMITYVAFPSWASAADDRPNILIVTASGLGYGDLGCYGSRDVPTPHLDQLARDGVRCTSGYATAPVDSPTRAALMTGRYPQRFGYEFNPPRDASVEFGLPATEQTLANRLSVTGYRCGFIGKWFLGNKPAYHPQRRGFAEFFGILEGAYAYLPADMPPITIDGQSSAAASPWPNYLLRGNDPVELREYLTDALSREAVEFIDRQSKTPFCLVVSYTAPQPPIEVTSEHYQRVVGITGGDHRRRVYAAMVSALDTGVGQVLETLKKHELDNRTLVIFLSDSGGLAGGYMNYASNAPLTGLKGDLLEGGLRVPLVVRWPGHVPAGAVYDQPVSVLDVLPTVLQAAGGTAPAELTSDGVDLLPYLAGKKTAAPHAALFWRYGDRYALRSGSWKAIRIGQEPTRLFDLATDVSESRNVASSHPADVKNFQRLWQAWEHDLIAPAWGKPARMPSW
ncbi:MAG: sulfatase-like hydrolase/transferase [Pirellulaceae bacterium]|nr:sulfatase-like hydrolase/transferase [Pirellulaceae bacterium]